MSKIRAVIHVYVLFTFIGLTQIGSGNLPRAGCELSHTMNQYRSRLLHLNTQSSSTYHEERSRFASHRQQRIESM